MCLLRGTRLNYTYNSWSLTVIEIRGFIPDVSSSNAALINLLTPNVNYSGRTAPLTSKVAFYIFIQQI